MQQAGEQVIDGHIQCDRCHDAQIALQDFVGHRLSLFGTYQGAMWTGEPFPYHSLLSPSLNLKLLNPRDVLDAAECSMHKHAAPLACVEGFVW